MILRSSSNGCLSTGTLINIYGYGKPSILGAGGEWLASISYAANRMRQDTNCLSSETRNNILRYIYGFIKQYLI